MDNIEEDENVNTTKLTKYIEGNKKMIILAGFPTPDLHQVRVWCPYCDQWHYHGLDRIYRPNRLSHRVEHCHGDSPFAKGGYYIKYLSLNEYEATEKGVRAFLDSSPIPSPDLYDSPIDKDIERGKRQYSNNAQEWVKFCLDRIEEGIREKGVDHYFSDMVCDNVTVEEVIGALISAEAYIDERERWELYESLKEEGMEHDEAWEQSMSIPGKENE